MHCSIIICTHNRANSLIITLNALTQQEYDKEKLEIIVVDNASTDQTVQIVQSVEKSSPYPVKYLYESELGLAFARNSGVNQAQGKIIFFIDDDAIPCNPDWVKTLTSVYGDPAVAAAGGDLKPVWPNGKRPEWLHDLLIYNLSLTNFTYDKVTELHYPLYPWGANISYRKSSILKLNGFSTDFARKGKDLMSGEESELYLRLQKAGYKVVFVPNAAGAHTVTPGQLTDAWFKKRAVSQGITDARIERLHLHGCEFIKSMIRRFVILVTCLGGIFLFKLFGARKLHLLCQCKLRVSWFFFLTVFGKMSGNLSND